MSAGRWRWVAVVFAAALVASIALGLLGLWPNLRGGESTSDKREKILIASALDAYIIRGGGTDHVVRVKLGYLPGRAMVETQDSGGHHRCVVVAEQYGNRIERKDYQHAPCDF
jgi:hypothetical protein